MISLIVFSLCSSALVLLFMYLFVIPRNKHFSMDYTEPLTHPVKLFNPFKVNFIRSGSPVKRSTYPNIR